LFDKPFREAVGRIMAVFKEVLSDDATSFRDDVTAHCVLEHLSVVGVDRK
jgi:hypothetical protein